MTAGNLLSRYMGGTGPNVVEAMRRAKGGILFVDLAYGMLPRHGSYGAEAAQALLDNITLPEFHGKLLVILSGYAEDIDALLGANPGLRSRFDKRRLQFRRWDSGTAAAALVESAARQGMGLTQEAQQECHRLFQQLQALPHYSSARDCDTVFKAMYQKRAARLGRRAREEGLRAGGAASVAVGRRRKRLPGGAMGPALEPYDAEDVRQAFQQIMGGRRGGREGGRRGGRRGGAAAAATAGDDGIGGDGSAIFDGQSAAGGSDGDGSDSQVAQLSSAAAFDRAVSGAPADCLLAVWFTAEWCPPCQQFKPQFLATAAAFRAVRFAAVDVDLNRDTAERLGVQSTPTVLLLGGGSGRELARLTGSQQLLRLKDELRSCSQQLLAEAFSRQQQQQPRAEQGGGGSSAAAALLSRPKVNTKVTAAPKVRRRAPEDEEEKKDSGDGDQELWAALEAALAALGYDLDAVVSLLESGDFPPADVLAHVQQQLGRGSRGAVAAMLRQQRPAVLKRMKEAQQELRRRKSEQERAALERVRALGRCPANFEWIKCQDGSGYRCAGGSHFVSEAEVNFVEM